jgi:hypothetical protein
MTQHVSHLLAKKVLFTKTNKGDGFQVFLTNVRKMALVTRSGGR